MVVGKRLRAAVVILTAALVLGGCSSSPSASSKGHRGGRLRTGQTCGLVTPAQAHRWLHARARGSASGAPSSLGGGVVTKVDECLYRSTRGEVGYVVTSSSLYAAGGMAGNLIQNEVVGHIRDLPGAREFHVPEGSTSFGYTLPLKGRFTGGADFLRGRYLVIILDSGLSRSRARQVALLAARQLGRRVR